MLDSGNLVVLDRKGRQLWASFDHPTDSLLLGQSLSQGQRLTANSSATNATRGQLFVEILDDGLHAFVDSNPPQLYYRNVFTGSSKPQNRSTFVTFNNGSLSMFVAFLQPGVPDMSIRLPTGSSCQYLRLEDNGHFRLYGWNNGWNLLGEVFNIFPDECAYPTVCGQYGICSNGQCTCPQSADGHSDYFKPVNSREINFGCSAVTPISCQSIESHQLLELDSVSYFNHIDSSAIAMDRVDVESCKQACLRNCSCKAALFQFGANASSGSCYLPSQVFSLMDNKPAITHYNSSTFVKVQTAPSGTPSPDGGSGTSRRTGTTHSWRKKLVIALVSSLLLAGLLVAFIIIYVRRRAMQLEEEDEFDEIPGMLSRFSYEELKSATKNFEQMLGRGGFGTVFKGTLSNGTDIAVKRLDGVGQAKKQFLAEVATIGSIHHINLVSLVGFCVEKSHKLLVMDYMPNGSLDTWIFGKTKDTSLDWQTRCNIILDIAKGLSYLHEECRHRIAHLDIKPQNILLDEKFNAKVADFGLSKLIDRDQREIMTRLRGTPGYLAPEWLTSIITEKVDVYSFGIVVLEIICGRKNLEPTLIEDDVNLIGLVQEKLQNDMLVELFDNNSIDIHEHEEEALGMMRLAVWCLQSDCNRRPSMSMVVKVLEGSANVDIDIDYDLLGAHFVPTKSRRPCSPSLADNNDQSSLLVGR